MSRFKNVPYSDPQLVWVTEPENKIRFRYKSEGGSHGGLAGKTGKKTYPTLQLINYNGRKKILVKVRLFTEDKKEHVLEFKGKKGEVKHHIEEELQDDNKVVFKNLQILSKKKDEIENILMERKISNLKDNMSRVVRTHFEKSYSKDVKERAKAILNSVRLHFEAFEVDNPSVPLCSVFSDVINNQKASAKGDLRITRLSHCTGSWKGGDEVILLCEKIQKDNIKVKFFETNQQSEVIWHDYGAFLPVDVHHQVAIAFKTPPFRKNIQKTVYLCLERNEEVSEPREFTYQPDEPSPKKRKLNDHQSETISSPENIESSESISSMSMSSPECSTNGVFDEMKDISDTLLNNSDILDNENPISEEMMHFIEMFNTIEPVEDFALPFEYVDNSTTSEGSYDEFNLSPPINGWNQTIQPDCTVMAGTSKKKKRIHIPEELNQTLDVGDIGIRYSNSKSDIKLIETSRESDVQVIITYMLKQLMKPFKFFDKSVTSDGSHDELPLSADNGQVRNQSIHPDCTVMAGTSKNERSIHIPEEFRKFSTSNVTCYETSFKSTNKYVQENIMNMLKLLLKRDIYNNTIFHIAILLNKNILNILKFCHHIFGITITNELINQQNNKSQTALHLAVEKDRTEVVSSLLKFGGNPNLKDSNGNTCYHIATEKNSPLVLSKINVFSQFQHKVNDFNKIGTTAVHMAIAQRNQLIFNMLLIHITNPNFKEKRAGKSLLHYAIEFQPSILHRLLEMDNIDVDIQDFSGRTPLHIACARENVEAVKQLLESGADPCIIDFSMNANNLDLEYSEDETSEGQSPSDLTENIEILELLKVANNPLNLQNPDSFEEDSEKNYCHKTDELCKYLDENMRWKELAPYFLDLDILDSLYLSSSPAKTLLNYIKKEDQDNYLQRLKTALEFANLTDAIEMLNI